MTALGLLPLVLMGGVVGTEIIQPLVIIIWGGLLTTTLFLLFVLPALLLGFGPEPASRTAPRNDPLLRAQSEDAP
ncbi:protein involved in drug transmembrane transport [Arthrobacter sp. Hiyo1]|uniref:hypothetical protein n=1 Tax=Arthrobacter sp. Hiyo1 TaxID=1588020 RepID=UPI0006A34DC9|nr:hypothetical protein [Arthrobacter sp. Hiyo1]GAP60231.1 protein involved in drug transmembrane transport [Arthrobacter sp. Hiyo1]